MKAFSIFAMSLLAASAAMATGNNNGGNNNPPPTTQACVTCPEINIQAPLAQTTTAVNSTIHNSADQGATARQNLASNSGNVDIKAKTSQSVYADTSTVWNEASGNSSSMATQNLSTNIGKVIVNGKLDQVTALYSSHAVNIAKNGAVATQNISTNNGCSVCNK